MVIWCLCSIVSVMDSHALQMSVGTDNRRCFHYRLCTYGSLKMANYIPATYYVWQVIIGELKQQWAWMVIVRQVWYNLLQTGTRCLWWRVCVCLWCRIYCWSTRQHWRPSIPTVRLRPLAGVARRPIWAEYQAGWSCHWCKEAQGSQGGHPTTWQLLWQAVDSHRHISAGTLTYFRSITDIVMCPV